MQIAFDILDMGCIFKTMRPSTYIFSLTLVIIFAGLHIEPLLAKHEVKKETGCARSKCPKQKPAPQQKQCPISEGCNPFVPCPMGSCCYVTENYFTPSGIIIPNRNKLPLINDNRLQYRLSQCWHPPELSS